MLINPLKIDNEETTFIKSYETNSDIVIGEIISFLIANYSEYLSDTPINRRVVSNIVREKVYKEYSNMNTESTISAILNRLFGYHILQKYIEDKEVTDIRATNYNNIFVKRCGVWESTPEAFLNELDYTNFVRYCVLRNGGKVTNESPIVTLSDKKNNLRIEAGIEPVNVIAPSLVIRIHRPDGISKLEDLSSDDIQMLNPEIQEFLHKAMIAGLNIVISGKGGSGKTTLMRTLINKIPENLSITSCEETAELYSTHPNIIQREILRDREKDKNVTLADLTSHALVMSNDCIVVGELKGEEAMSFFDAISTGHRGYATVHSDSSKSTADRLVTLMKRDTKAQMYSDKYLRKLLATSLDLVIYMSNFKVQEITEVLYDKETDDISYNPLYEFKVERYEKGKSIGKFKKLNKPTNKIKEKIDLSKLEIERIMG